MQKLALLAVLTSCNCGDNIRVRTHDDHCVIGTAGCMPPVDATTDAPADAAIDAPECDDSRGHDHPHKFGLGYGHDKGHGACDER